MRCFEIGKANIEVPPRHKFWTGHYMADGPELDATDGAHPAWWRGHDSGCVGTAKQLLKVARNGGTFGNPDLEAARKEIARLYAIEKRTRAYMADDSPEWLALAEALDVPSEVVQ